MKLQTPTTIQYLGKFSIYSIAEIIANLSGWFFTALAVRSLSLAAYGDLHFWLQLTMIFSVLVVPMRICVNKFLALPDFKDLMSLVNLGKVLFFAAVTLGILLLLSFDYWRDSFNFSGTSLMVVLLGMQLGLMVMAAWQRGALLAWKQFAFVAASIGVELLSRGILTWWAFEQSSLIAFAVSIVVPSLLIVFFMQVKVKAYVSLEKWNTLTVSAAVKKFYMNTAVFRVGVAWVLIIDFIMVKWWATASVAGLYALVVLSGRVLFFLAQTFFVLLTPLVAPYLNSRSKRQRLFVVVLGGYILIALSYIGLVFVIPEYSLGLLMGDSYEMILPYLPWYLASVLVLSVTSLASLFQILMEKYLYTIAVFAGLFVEVVLLWLRHDSIEEVIQGVFVAALTTLLIVLAFWVRERVFRRSLADDTAASEN